MLARVDTRVLAVLVGCVLGWGRDLLYPMVRLSDSQHHADGQQCWVDEKEGERVPNENEEKYTLSAYKQTNTHTQGAA